MNKDHKIKELEGRIAKLEEEIKLRPLIIINPAPIVPQPVPCLSYYPQIGWPVPPYTTYGAIC